VTAVTLAAAYAAATARAAQAPTQTTSSAANPVRAPEPAAPPMPDETMLMALLRHSLSASDQVMARKALARGTPWESGRR